MSFDFASVRDAFFDAPKIKQMMDQKSRQALSKMGAFIRRRARSSIRRNQKVSEPGRPPHAHTSAGGTGFAAGIKFIVFAYDARAKSAIIGPIAFNQGKGECPELLEHGGVKTHRRSGKRLFYRERPFMQPALEEELPRFAQLYRG